MKYKKQIATGALALSLLVGGTSVFAATPQDLGVKSVQKTYQKESKTKTATTKKSTEVGTVSALTGTGFTLDVKNLKTKVTTSVDVKTDASTVYKKDGASAVATDLVSGQKVIVTGTLDKTTNTLTAKTVKIVTKAEVAKKVKEVKKEVKTAAVKKTN